jgi:hypothetical protein
VTRGLRLFTKRKEALAILQGNVSQFFQADEIERMPWEPSL